MTKYKTLLPLPGVPVGTISDDAGLSTVMFGFTHYPLSEVELCTDFFQKIEDTPETIYDLKDGDEYWCVDQSMIRNIAHTINKDFYDVPELCFLTKREAQRELAFRLLRNRKDKFTPKIHERYNNIFYDESNYWINEIEDIISYNSGFIFRSLEEREQVLSTIVNDGLTIKDLIFSIS